MNPTPRLLADILAECSNLVNLRTLQLDRCGISETGARALARSDRVRAR